MPTTTSSDISQKVSINKYGYNAIVRNTSMAIFTSLPLFVAAGTTDWTWAWIYSLTSLFGWTALNVMVARQNPGLLNERGKPTRQMTANSKRWDLVILSFYSLLLFVVPIVAGFDYRYGWSSGEPSPIVQIIGLMVFLFGFIPLTWAMAANKFFEPTVRIQTERGHSVTDTGPYRFVRHPSYVGIILHFITPAIVLGTWTALLPGLIGAGLFVVRTAMEDQTLREELPGYADFATRTRYRLLPGVW